MTLRAGCACLVMLPALAWAGGQPQRVVDRGVAVEFAPAPLQPSDGEPLTIAFAIRDAATTAPIAGVRPAAWLARRDGERAATGAACTRKAATFLGGSLTTRPAADFNEYYVLALNDDASINVVDPRFGFGGSHLLARVELESRGEDWVLSRDGSTLFVSMTLAGTIAAADTVSWKVRRNIAAGRRPGRLVLQPDGARLWVLSDDAVTAIDTQSLEVVATLAAPGASALAVTSDSRFVVAAASGALIVADARDIGPAVRVPLAFTPRTIAFSTAAQLAYAGDPATGAVAALDVASRAIVARFEAAPGFTQLRFDPGGRYGFLPNPDKNTVEIFDTATNRIVRSAEVGDGPDQVTFSDRLAYIRRRGSDTILMLPLEQLRSDTTSVSLADFTGGEHAMGRGRWGALADSIVGAPDGVAVLVANPADRAIYYYKEGMAAPMGGFNNYSREPRAVLVVDRSLRERPGGIYATTATVDEPGRYEVVFLLDSPRVVSCFALDVAARPQTAGKGAPDVTVVAIDFPQRAKAGVGTPLRFRLSNATTEGAIVAGDVEVLAMQAPGVWQKRQPAHAEGSGVYTVTVTPPNEGVYYLWVTSASAGLPLNNRQFFVLKVE
jgi:DNA-binding beta-propeller fold protein YncE